MHHAALPGEHASAEVSLARDYRPMGMNASALLAFIGITS
jgi:hypothetical protein